MASTANDPFASPDSVQLKGRVTGVTRLSRKAKALMTMVVIAGFVGVLFAILTAGEAENTTTTASDPDEADRAKAKGVMMVEAGAVTKDVPDGQASAMADKLGVDTSLQGGIDIGALNGGQAASEAAAAAPASKQPASAVATETAPTVPAVNAAAAPSAAPAETPAQQAARRLRDEREDKARRARDAPMEGSGTSEMGAAGAAASNPQLAGMIAQAQAALDAVGKGGSAAGAGGGLGLGGQQQEQDDINRQGRKEAFLRDAGASSKSTYLQEVKQKPLGKYEVKAGWNIPMVLECGINSDLPGQTCARVSENVYDTVTGRYLLIPQGTKAIGMYDSRISFGQSRLLVVWNRLIFPDGSSFVLQGMPGTDGAGNAGFDGEVNNHYFRLFAGAAMMSLISAGAQLSQPQQSQTGSNAPSAQQTIAAAMGQQLAQVSGALISRNMQIQPTITQAPGYRFNITLTKDMLFPAQFGR